MASRLKSYRSKRNFEVTPEPPPEAEAEAEAPARGERAAARFMIHKHDASRMHYDLRLEMEGALASWAIPRGPSYDPAEKRLAVQTEDHPLAYGDFEGRIPDGEYGGGDSLIWDRGTYRTEPPGRERAMRDKGHLVLVLEGEKLRGLWHLVRTRPVGGKAQWLFFKGKDERADPAFDVVAQRPESVVSGRRLTRGPVSARTLRARHPQPIDLLLRTWPPARATLCKPEAVGPGPWSFEVKYDGYRALAGLAGGRIALQSRNGLDLSSRFPELARALARLRVGEAVIDGEIVALDPKGRSRFGLLQEAGAEQRYVAFDLLWLEGEDLRTRPLEERRELLESLFANAEPPLQLAERLPGPLEKALARSRARGLEGLVLKRAGSRFRGGQSGDWLKVKNVNSQEVAVVGFLPISTGARQVGALLVAVQEDGRLRFAGRVGTGFTSAVRGELWRTLERERVETPPAAEAPRLRTARWVEPKHVAQVAFTEWTRDGMLRHPSFQGLRSDKRPEECVREVPAARPARRGAARR